MVKPVAARHADSVDREPEARTSRLEEIDLRIVAIRLRLSELDVDHNQRDNADTAAASGRLSTALHNVALSQAAAQRAMVSSIHAFRRAAHAHVQTACQHERAAAAGIGDRDEHQRQAASHRAAATADEQRADRAQALLAGAANAGGDG
jgi:hypothetical protein